MAQPESAKCGIKSILIIGRLISVKQVNCYSLINSHAALFLSGVLINLVRPLPKDGQFTILLPVGAAERFQDSCSALQRPTNQDSSVYSVLFVSDFDRAESFSYSGSGSFAGH
jgi:hypothetical protein